MPRAKHPCAEPGCPTAVPHGTSRCPDHQRARDKARGSRQQRGYGAAHDRLRATLATHLAAGHTIPCARCGAPIGHGDDWHLDHTDDRADWLGPSCALCNLSAAGKAAHR